MCELKISKNILSVRFQQNPNLLYPTKYLKIEYNILRDMSFLHSQSKEPQQQESKANQYFITIPRCKINKKWLFDGIEEFCYKLAVSKERHSLVYKDSCCYKSTSDDGDHCNEHIHVFAGKI